MMATALPVIDVQMDFVSRRDRGMVWGNPKADTSIATLLAAFRDSNGKPSNGSTGITTAAFSAP